MLIYDDTIIQDEQPIDNTTIVYIVKSNDGFLVRAISSGLENIMKDPTTNELEYWLINDANTLLGEQHDNPLFFEDEKLIAKNLTAEQVLQYLKVDPLTQSPTPFDAKSIVKKQLLNDYAHFMDRPDPLEIVALALRKEAAKNYIEAQRLYTQAIELGSEDAMNNLARIHKMGLLGEVNFVEAIRLYERAIGINSAHAMYNLGMMYEKGMDGQPNYPEALKLYDRAITQNHVPSMLRRAGLYQNKSVGAINYPAAIDLLRRAKFLADDPATARNIDVYLKCLEKRINKQGFFSKIQSFGHSIIDHFDSSPRKKM